MKDVMNDISGYLLKNNIKPSVQRIKILEFVIKGKRHPTVDEIYKDLVQEIPTLSRTTVYNTLKLFIESKIVRGLYIENNEIRYDYIMNDHGHFKCNSCGEIFDFSVDIDRFQSDELKKFQILDKGVYFKGLCPKCIKN